jgi:hypothetical protein
MSDHPEVVISIRVPVGVRVTTEPSPWRSDRDASITMRSPDDNDSPVPAGDLPADGVVSPRTSKVTGNAVESDKNGTATGRTIPGTNVQNKNGTWTMTFAGLTAGGYSYRITVSGGSGTTHSVTVKTA